MQVPLLYFRGVAPARYSLLYPCYVTRDDPGAQAVVVEKGLVALELPERGGAVLPDEVERRYVMRELKLRLHQQRFRQIVLRAYGERCTICRLREPALLNASHILPDRDRRGEASVPNGLSLCVIHHEAFDRNLLGITPDYRVRLSRRLLEDEDGPMLEQGLKAFHDQRIKLPRRLADHPSRPFLEERLSVFESAA
jgi:putative restriction endonuclease